MPETWIQSLCWEDALEEGLATHSSILVWRIPMDRAAWWATVHGVAKSQSQLNECTRACAHTHTWTQTHTDTHTYTLSLSVSLKERGLHRDVDSWTGGHWKPL